MKDLISFRALEGPEKPYQLLINKALLRDQNSAWQALAF